VAIACSPDPIERAAANQGQALRVVALQNLAYNIRRLMTLERMAVA
jgi:hypothetical protein